MKILFAIKALDDITGGAERVLCDVSGGLTERGHDVSLLSFDKSGGEPFYPLHQSVRRICLEIGNPKAKAGFGETLNRMKSLRQTVRQEQPDIVIAFMHSMFVPMALALAGTGIPVIASEHIVPQHYKNKPLEYILLTLCGLMVKRITVLTERVKQLYPAILQRRMTVMPNPVAMPDGKAHPAVSHSGRKTILNIGRLDPQKDQKTLIAAFARLAAHYEEWDVRIIGEGPLENDLKKQITDLSLESRITLPGTTKDIGKEYEQANIFALPSLYEGFGLVTVEAMSYGLPVIGFADCPGTNEIVIDQQTGFLAAGPDRVAAFAEKLEMLMKSDEHRTQYGSKGRDIAKQYAPEKIIDKWEELIKACL